jgi:hypothetical protein
MNIEEGYFTFFLKILNYEEKLMSYSMQSYYFDGDLPKNENNLIL